MSQKMEKMKLRRVTRRDINQPSTSKDITSSEKENDDSTSPKSFNSDQSNNKALKRPQSPLVDDSLADFKSPKFSTRSTLAPNTVKLLEVKKNPPKKQGKTRASSTRNSKKKTDINQISIESSLFKPPTSFVCPLCLKCFNDSNQQIAHSKNCAAKNNISTKKLIAAVQLHERQVEERAAIGLPAAPLQQPKKKAPNLRKLKSNDDPDVELAIALSKSLSEAQEIAELDEAMALASETDRKFCEMSPSEKRQTLVNFGFSTNRPSSEISAIDKQHKRKKITGSTLLQTRTEEVRNRLLAERIAEIIVDNVAMTQRTFSEVRNSQNNGNSEFKSNLLKNIYRSDSILWNGSTCQRENEFYYVKGLCEFIKPVNEFDKIEMRGKRESQVLIACVNGKSVEKCDIRQKNKVIIENISKIEENLHENLLIESSFSNISNTTDENREESKFIVKNTSEIENNWHENLLIKCNLSRKSNEFDRNQQANEFLVENAPEIVENRHDNSINNKNIDTIDRSMNKVKNDSLQFNHTQRINVDGVCNSPDISRHWQGNDKKTKNNPDIDCELDEADGEASEFKEIGENRQEKNYKIDRTPHDTTIKEKLLETDRIDIKETLTIEKLSALAVSWSKMINSSACSDVIIFVKNDKFIFSHYVVLWSRCCELDRDFVVIDHNQIDMKLINLEVNPKFKVVWENVNYDSALIFLEFIYCECVINSQALKEADILNDVKNLAGRYKVEQLIRILENFELRIQENYTRNVDNQISHTESSDCNCENSITELKTERIVSKNENDEAMSDISEVMCEKFVKKDAFSQQNHNACGPDPEIKARQLESPISIISEDECDAELGELQLSINRSYKNEVLRASHISVSPDIFDGMDSMYCSFDNTTDKEQTTNKSVSIELNQPKKSLRSPLSSTSFVKFPDPSVQNKMQNTDGIGLEKPISPETFLSLPLSTTSFKKSSDPISRNRILNTPMVGECLEQKKFKCRNVKDSVSIAVETSRNMSIRQDNQDAFLNIRDEHVTKRKTFARQKSVKESDNSEEDDRENAKSNVDNDEPTDGIVKLRNNLSLFIEKIQRRNERFLESDTDEDDSLVILPLKRKNPFKKRTSDDDSGLACKFKRKNLISVEDSKDQEKKQYGGREKFIKRIGNTSNTDCEVRTALSLFEDKLRARVAAEQKKNEGNAKYYVTNDEKNFPHNYDSVHDMVDVEMLQESNENSIVFQKTSENVENVSKNYQISKTNDIDIDSFEMIDENWSKIEENLGKCLEENRKIPENSNISETPRKNGRSQTSCRNDENISVRQSNNDSKNSGNYVDNFSSIDFDDFTDNEEEANESMYAKYMKTHRRNSIDKYRTQLGNYFSENREKTLENSGNSCEVRTNNERAGNGEKIGDNLSSSLFENLEGKNFENLFAKDEKSNHKNSFSENNKDNYENDQKKESTEKSPENFGNVVKNRRISMINQRHLMELSSFDLYECEEIDEEQHDPGNSENSHEISSPIDLTQSSDDEKTSSANSPEKLSERYYDDNFLENEENHCQTENDGKKSKTPEKCEEKFISSMEYGKKIIGGNFNSIHWTHENDFNQSEYNGKKDKAEDPSLVATEYYDLRVPQFNPSTELKDAEENSFTGTPTVTEDVTKILHDCGILTSFTENTIKNNPDYNKTIAEILSPIVLSSDSEYDNKESTEVNDIPDDVNFDFGSNFYHDEVNNDDYEHNDFGSPLKLNTEDGTTRNIPGDESFDELNFPPCVFEGGADINTTNKLEDFSPSTSLMKSSTHKASAGEHHLSEVGNKFGHLPLPKTPNKLPVLPTHLQISSRSIHSLSTSSDEEKMAKGNNSKLLQLDDEKVAGNDDSLKLRRFSSVSPKTVSNVRLLKNKSVSEGNFPSPRRRTVSKKSPTKVSVCKGKEKICKYLDLQPSEVEISIDVPPKEDYDRLSSPELKKRLAKFGLKNQKRHRAVKLLNYIYEQMYPLVPEELVPTDWLNKSKTCGLSSSENARNPKEMKDGGDSDDSIKEPNVIRSECLEDMDFSDDGDDVNGADNHGDVVESLKQNFAKVLESDTVFHRKILMYEPIPLEIFVNKMEKFGAKVKPKILADLLNSECISFFIDAPKKWSAGIRKQKNK